MTPSARASWIRMNRMLGLTLPAARAVNPAGVPVAPWGVPGVGRPADRGVPGGEDPPGGGDQPVAGAGGGGGHGDDWFVEPQRAGGAVEPGIAEAEDAAVGGDQPVAVAGGGGGHGDDWF